MIVTENLKLKTTKLPKRFFASHDLCIVNHDVLAELLRSGQRNEQFAHSFTFRDEADRAAFEAAPDPFAWLEQTNRKDERAQLLRTVVFPALISDFLHFVYETLEAARKAKLTVAYALLRKPMRDHLGLLELMASELDGFAERLVERPTDLDARRAGGMEGHVNRISAVLERLGEDHCFDARYLAQLRYDRSADDSFAGICDKANHLFTDFSPIKTENMNINFIFSGPEQWKTQWAYLYSRLPYVLSYARLLFEHVAAGFSLTSPSYQGDIEMRLSARVVLWSQTVDDDYYCEEIAKFVGVTQQHLFDECERVGHPVTRKRDLKRMQLYGTWPGETKRAARKRRAKEHQIELDMVEEMKRELRQLRSK